MVDRETVGDIEAPSDRRSGDPTDGDWGHDENERNPTEPATPDDLVEEDPMRAPGLDDPEKMISE